MHFYNESNIKKFYLKISLVKKFSLCVLFSSFKHEFWIRIPTKILAAHTQTFFLTTETSFLCFDFLRKKTYDLIVQFFFTSTI